MNYDSIIKLYQSQHCRETIDTFMTPLGKTRDTLLLKSTAQKVNESLGHLDIYHLYTS